MTRFYLLCMLMLLTASCSDTSFSTADKEKVTTAVREQLQAYPHSRLQDIYKNFFQDYFGPGHLIPDTTVAANYLRSELSSYSETTGKLVESTGWRGNFYRVNLSILKENKIPYQVFFNAFVASAKTSPAIAPEKWPAEWHKILAVIEGMNVTIAGYQADKEQLEQWLKEGKYVVHHSDTFNHHYQPHYRIIEKHIFEEQIQVYLE